MIWRSRRSLSIATRLFLSAVICSLIILLVAGVVLSAIYRRATEQSFDEKLNVYLRALVADVAAPTADNNLHVSSGQLGEPQFELPLSGWYWQIARIDTPQPQIQTSRSLFAERLPKLPDRASSGSTGAKSGYVTGPDGQPLRMLQRVIDADNEGVYFVQVAAVTSEIDDRIWRFEASLTATFVVLALALAGVTTVQVRFGLRPLRRLQYEVAGIRRGMGERIEGVFPDDLAPLAAELNLLIDWNRQILSRAQTHVGNLAHALKTPLSVLLNEAATDRSPLSLKVRDQAQAMNEQVAYYLNRARAATRVGLVGSSTEVKPVLDGLLRTFEKIYDKRAIEFEADAEPGLRVRAERQDLEEMLGNLIDNAGKWARSRVVVAAAAEETNAIEGAVHSFLILTIDDDGSGLPEGSRAAAVARGGRLDESKPGSGLGLAIVADLASIHGGSLILDDSPRGGLRAKLRLPAG